MPRPGAATGDWPLLAQPEAVHDRQQWGDQWRGSGTVPIRTISVNRQTAGGVLLLELE